MNAPLVGTLDTVYILLSCLEFLKSLHCNEYKKNTFILKFVPNSITPWGFKPHSTVRWSVVNTSGKSVLCVTPYWAGNETQTITNQMNLCRIIYSLQIQYLWNTSKINPLCLLEDTGRSQVWSFCHVREGHLITVPYLEWQAMQEHAGYKRKTFKWCDHRINAYSFPFKISV